MRVSQAPQSIRALALLVAGLRGALVPGHGGGVIPKPRLVLRAVVIELPLALDFGVLGLHLAEHLLGLDVFLAPVERERLHQLRVGHVGALREARAKLAKFLDRGGVVALPIERRAHVVERVVHPLALRIIDQDLGALPDDAVVLRRGFRSGGVQGRPLLGFLAIAVVALGEIKRVVVSATGEGDEEENAENPETRGSEVRGLHERGHGTTRTPEPAIGRWPGGSPRER